MTLGEFKTIIRLMVPSANKTRISDSALETLINKAIRNVNNSAKVLVKKKFFDATTSEEYTISDIPNINDFVLIGNSGLWFNKGTTTTTNYRQLDGVTRAWLDDNRPNWYNAGSGDPLYALFEPNLITVHPKPSAALTNGFLLPDYVYKPTTVANNDNYPFSGNATEYPGLEVLDDAIISYVRYLLAWSVGEKSEGVITHQIYQATLKEAGRMFRRRPDYKANRDFRLKSIRTNY